MEAIAMPSTFPFVSSTGSVMSDPRYFYVTQAASPSGITHCSYEYPYLFTVMHSVLAVYRLTETLLTNNDTVQPQFQLVVEAQCNAKIIAMQRMSQKNIFILDDRSHFALIELDIETRTFKTTHFGQLQAKLTRRGLKAFTAIHTAAADNNNTTKKQQQRSSFIAVHFYDGLVHIINLNTMETSDHRLEEINLHQMDILYRQTPTLVVLYSDSRDRKHLRHYELRNGALVPQQPEPLEPSTSFIIPTLWGLIAVSNDKIDFYGSTRKTTSITPVEMTVWTRKDDYTLILGDLAGNIYSLRILTNGQANMVTSLEWDYICAFSSPEALAWIDDQLLFIGSRFGDSMLVKVDVSGVDGKPFATPIQEFVGIGPIIDFVVLDSDVQPTMVTCSGAYRDGSLRIIREGVTIAIEASIALPGIQAMWTINCQNITYLLQSYVSDTRVLAIESDELGEVESPGIVSECSLLCAGVGQYIVQVTKHGVRVLSAFTFNLVHEWRPQCPVSIARNHESMMLLACGPVIYLLQIDEAGCTSIVSSRTLDNEVSCIDISSSIIAIGLWSANSLHLLAVPTLDDIAIESVNMDIQIRSLLFVSFDCPYLFCGLGDGQLVSWQIANHSLQSQRIVNLGSTPVHLTMLSGSTEADCSIVFACSDRPVIVSSKNGKLVYSSVHIKDVNAVASFSTGMLNDGLAIATNEFLSIGRLESFQNLNIRSILLGEQTRRIINVGQYVVVATIRWEDSATDVSEQNYLRVFDAHFIRTDPIASFTLDNNEVTQALSLLRVGAVQYLVVGTAYFLDEEEQPSAGRVLLLTVEEDGSLILESETKLKGAANTIDIMGNRVVTSVNSRVLVLDVIFKDGQVSLQKDCAYPGSTLAIELRVLGEYIAVGDLFKSVSLLMYKNGKLEQVASDYDSAWIQALEFIHENTVLYGDMDGNLCGLCRDLDEVGRLLPFATFHVGDNINRIRSGSLVRNLSESDVRATHLFGTTSGAIGVIAPLTKEQFSWLMDVEEALEQIIRPVGKFSHSEFRMYHTERRNQRRKNVVDGLFIEQFLDLTFEEQLQVSRLCHHPVDEIRRLVEELSRIY